MRDKILNLPGCTSTVVYRGVFEKNKATIMGVKEKSTMADKNNETGGKMFSQKISPHMCLKRAL